MISWWRFAMLCGYGKLVDRSVSVVRRHGLAAQAVRPAGFGPTQRGGLPRAGARLPGSRRRDPELGHNLALSGAAAL